MSKMIALSFICSDIFSAVECLFHEIQPRRKHELCCPVPVARIDICPWKRYQMVVIFTCYNYLFITSAYLRCFAPRNVAEKVLFGERSAPRPARAWALLLAGEAQPSRAALS
jgi:hypothetical protein